MENQKQVWFAVNLHQRRIQVLSMVGPRKFSRPFKIKVGFLKLLHFLVKRAAIMLQNLNDKIQVAALTE